MTSKAVTPCQELVVYQPRPTIQSLLEKAVDETYRRSLEAQRADYGHFHRWGRGDVIVLAGTSTAGKSSIVESLKRLEPERIEEDLDLRRDPRIMTRPGDQQQMIDDVIDHSLQGRNVVVHVDQGYKVIQRLFERNVSVPLRVVLAFCPFHELSKRLIERNAKARLPGGDIKNIRDPLMPIANFAELYTQKQGAEPGLERITKLQATIAFNTHFDEMIKFAREQGHPLPSDEQIAIDKTASLQEFLVNLGFKGDVDTVEIDPRNKADYHFIFNTYEHRDQAGLDEIARILHTGTYKRI